MKKLAFVLALVVGLFLLSKVKNNPPTPSPSTQSDVTAVSPDNRRTYVEDAIVLPKPKISGGISVESALATRRSKRTFTDQPLTLNNVSQLLWAMQGVTSDTGQRTAPSAKEAYPLEITLVARQVQGLEPGVYHYLPSSHSVRKMITGVPERFDEAAVQAAGKGSPAAFVISGNMARMTKVFDGKANNNNVYLEAGHTAQNLYLQVESLKLGTVVIGGFNNALMQDVLAIPKNETLIYLAPAGHPAPEQNP